MKFDFDKEPGKKLLDRNLNADDVPLMSIITPFYNKIRYFEQTFNSVMNQTFPWFEWIIVNDGTTNDEEVKKLKEIASRDNRIKLFHQENSGQSSARNHAIRKCSTEIIVPLDADDLIEPTFLEYVFWGLYFNPDASWCYTDSLGFQDDNYEWKKEFSSEEMKTNNILTCTAAIRKKDLLEIGCYDDSEKHYDEDWRLWLMFLSKNKYPVHIAQYGFWYRKTQHGMATQVQKNIELSKKSAKIIKQVADRVRNDIRAKEYPVKNGESFIKPENINWSRKVFKNHNKINVMLLIPWMVMGGADLFNLDIVRKIDKNKFEMSIITTLDSDNSWKQLFQEFTSEIFELSTFLEIENYSKFISYFIKSREIDVIFLSNSYYGYYLVPWLRKEFPNVAIVDYVHMEEWYWRNGGFARTSGALGDIIEKTYTCNEKTRKVIINDFGKNPKTIETLYIGVDKEKYYESVVEENLAKKSLKIEKNRPIILFPCRIHPQKRPFLMLEIAREIRKKLKNIAFIVVGDGPQLEELQQKVSEYNLTNTVYFAGRQNDMRPYYKDSDITLICSLKEGLALTAYESLAMGTPVISSDVGGQSELIDNEVGAILPLLQDESEALDSRKFSSEEVMSYVIAIEEILGNKERYKSMCKLCRDRIEQKFSSDIMIKRIEGEFENIISDEYLEKRQNFSKLLKQISFFVDDYMTIFLEYENSEYNCEEIWKSKMWFENLYNDICCGFGQNGVYESKISADGNSLEIQRRLDEIYNMRTWKLIEKYRRFMDNTIIGKCIRKIFNFIGLG
ncbi:glycosyltransferase [Clostridium beijerinckii]|uniref:Glycosyl transferase family 2 n=1 Tax=Clostridium beijerinckii TaxID=1520 RepID=A0A1S9NB66_CLOBE|nr:glycosyltransferase [Clostridium beijerinckii]OOP74787.1 glycosyl transferase family 2 [Clostridium beijerinckii]